MAEFETGWDEPLELGGMDLPEEAPRLGGSPEGSDLKDYPRFQTFLDYGPRVFGAGSNPIGIRAHNDLVRVWASHPRIGGGAGRWCRLSRKWRVVGCASSWRRCRMGKEEINQHLFKKEVTDPFVRRPRTTSLRRNGCPSCHRVRVLASRQVQSRLCGAGQDDYDEQVPSGVGQSGKGKRERGDRRKHSGALGSSTSKAFEGQVKGNWAVTFRELSEWSPKGEHPEEASLYTCQDQARSGCCGGHLGQRCFSEVSERSKKPQGIGQALYAAVEQRQLLDKRPGAAVELASSSKRKKKKKKEKKKKKKDSSSGSSYSSNGSSSDDLKPPLQKKAERKPGSVLKMLMDHVRLSLSDLSLGHSEEGGAASSVTSTARVQSYFQILVRPQLTNRQRDEKELFSLALGLDLLRQGQMEKVADLMAGRYIAVETAALEGSWDTAKWLEVSRLEDRGAANAEVLLAARKHQRTIDRASGRGSYGRGEDLSWGAGSYGASHWSDGGAGPGRGKGKKGKKGKGKSKKGKAGKKGWESSWWDDYPQKEGGEKDPPKKGDSSK